MQLGLINYSNSYPFVLDLISNPIDGVEITQGIPSELNSKLHEGVLDVSAISSFEYLRHAQDYALLPKWCINSKGAVKSVLLFSKVPFEKLGGSTIQLTTHSATSIHLLKVLMAMENIEAETWLNGDDPKSDVDAMLLIGDAALRVDLNAFPHVMDLAQAWSALTGYPAVFGVQAVRLDRLEQVRSTLPELLSRLEQTNRRLKQHGLQGLLPKLQRAFPDIQLDFETYFQCLDFDFSEDCLKGLRHYADACTQYGFLSETPPLAPLAL